MNRFDIIKPVEGHPDNICCTECWQRGINWGYAGTLEEIQRLLDSHHDYEYLERSEPHGKPSNPYDEGYLDGIEAAIALIEREKND